MKTALKSLVASFLAFLARAVLRKYKPIIVMVTGSVGKTSTKDAVAAALATTRYLRKSEKSYNSEFGVPLTIIGAKNAWSDAVAWIGVIQEALALLLLPSHYPKLLVLEVGADRPGDLARILRIATPDVVVVTRLPDVPVHVEAYASPAAVREEEFAPAYALAPSSPLVISSDNQYAVAMAARLPARTITYGAGKEADVSIQHPEVVYDGWRPVGMKGHVNIQGTVYDLTVLGSFGRSQLYGPGAALATALALQVSVADAFAGLATYEPPPGRARILRGRLGSVLVDDSYNASPAAMEEVLASLSLATGATRRIAVLGDMLELGRYSISEHERIGVIAAKHADIVVGVGQRARSLQVAAVAAGLPEESALVFATASEAAAALYDVVQDGDLVLIKGSQSMRMERIVERLLLDPTDSMHLVRQEREWKKR